MDTTGYVKAYRAGRRFYNRDAGERFADMDGEQLAALAAKKFDNAMQRSAFVQGVYDTARIADEPVRDT